MLKSQTFIVDQVRELFGSGPLLNLRFQLTHSDLAHLWEECTVDRHRNVEADCNAESFNGNACRAHSRWHQLSAREQKVPGRGQEKDRDRVGASTNHRLVDALLSGNFRLPVLVALCVTHSDTTLHLSHTHDVGVGSGGTRHCGVADEVAEESGKAT